MKRTIIRRAVLAVAICLASNIPLWASPGVGGRSAFEFMKISPVTRAVAVGEAYSAMGDDVGSIHYNPAGLASILTNELNFTYLMLYQDISYEYIAFAYPLGQAAPKIGGTLAASVNLIQLGSMDRVNDDAEILGTFTSGNSLFTFSYARAFGDYVHSGFNLKYVRQQIDTIKQTAVNVDFGVVVLPPFEGLRVGVVARNLGGSVDDFDMPLVLNTSASYRMYELFSYNDDICFAVECDIPVLPIEDRLGMRAGLEYDLKWVGHRVTVRGGYKFLDTDVEGVGLTVGGGYGVDIGGTILFLDYAFAPAGDFGQSHRMSLTAKF
jgi:hypothetical protein